MRHSVGGRNDQSARQKTYYAVGVRVISMRVSRKVAMGIGLLLLFGVIFGGQAALQTSKDNSCPPSLHVHNSTETNEMINETIVEYEKLSDRRQTEFREALKDDTYPEINTTYGAWVNTSHVRYRGDIYSTGVAVC